MRALKIVTVVMGVMIVAGTIVLAVAIARRLSGTDQHGGAFAVQLAEPDGTRIGGIAGSQDRLVVQLEGGGPDRIVLIDPRTGAMVGRIALAPPSATPPH